ncbi:MAG: M23 family metallopeptidase [Spirochaetes bacterium]|nr:M23 family metallopeptidase [Spirochaetota bacterium]
MPEGLSGYKKKEKLLYAKLVAGSKALFGWLAAAFARILAWARRRTFIEIIPEAARPSRRLRINNLSLSLIALAFIGLFGFAIFAVSRFAYVFVDLEIAKRDLAESRVMVDNLRDRVETLSGSALKFEASLSGLLAAVAKNEDGADLDVSVNRALGVAGLTSLLNMPESGDLGNRELARLKDLTGYLDSAVPGLEKASTILAGQKEIMSEIPNIWPIQGGIGHVSMYFGQNENPFSSGQWYLHSGIDISTFHTGDPIVATADGKVIAASYDGTLGNAVTIQHSHGFLTRYGHLRAFKVSIGQIVTQGQVIATLGNTGQTTGPHLHYEVHLGMSIIDPLRFLNKRQETIEFRP